MKRKTEPTVNVPLTVEEICAISFAMGFVEGNSLKEGESPFFKPAFINHLIDKLTKARDEIKK